MCQAGCDGHVSSVCSDAFLVFFLAIASLAAGRGTYCIFSTLDAGRAEIPRIAWGRCHRRALRICCLNVDLPSAQCAPTPGGIHETSPP
jgi:hypothetical protein